MSVESEDLAQHNVCVWGISVAIDAAGRRRWPKEIKRMAVKKVASGATIAGLAREIGVNEGNLGKWVRKGQHNAPEMPRFVPLAISDSTRGLNESEPFMNPVISGKASPQGDQPRPGECILQIRDATLRFPIDMPMDKLSEIIRTILLSV